MLLTKRRFPSAFLLETERTKLLLDCGFGALARLADQEVDPRTLDGVFVSHFHPDHIGDAFNLIAARFVGNLYQGQPQRLLHCYGPEALQERFLKWREVVWPEANEHHPLEFHEGAGEYRLGDLELATFAVRHVPWLQSVGVRVRAGGRTLAYTGDVAGRQDFTDLVEAVRGVDLLAIESGYETSQPTHLASEETAAVAERAGVGAVLLTHVRAKDGEDERLRRFTADHPKFTLAEDGLVVDL